MKFFTSELKRDLNKASQAATKKRVERHSNENKLLKRLNSILNRKDVINLDNNKVDALRMLAFHFEDNKGMSATRLVEILKA
jgi:hypothetical protein